MSRRYKIYTENPISIEVAKLLGCPFVAMPPLSMLSRLKAWRPEAAYKYVPTCNGPVPYEWIFGFDNTWRELPSDDYPGLDLFFRERVFYRIEIEGDGDV